MKIKMLKATNCDGSPVKAGQVVEASVKSAKFLINIQFAEEHTEKPKPKSKPAALKNKAVTASELETRDAG